MQSATDSLFGRLFFEEEEKPRLCFRSAPPGQSDSNTSTSFCGKCTFQKLASSSSTLFLLLLFLNHQVPTGRHDTKFQGGIKMLPSYIQEAFFFFFLTQCVLAGRPPAGHPGFCSERWTSVVPRPKALARLGPPCACMTLKYKSIYFSVVHVDQLFWKIILLFTHGWWC